MGNNKTKGKTLFTREELYERVWSHPLRYLSGKYAISDNGLRKICKRMQIPVPNGGHWARLPVNRSPRVRLSGRYTGDQTIELEIRVAADDSEKIALAQLTDEIRDSRVVRIFENLVDPDELVLASKKVLICRRAFFNRGVFGRLFPALSLAPPGKYHIGG